MTEKTTRIYSFVVNILVLGLSFSRLTNSFTPSMKIEVSRLQNVGRQSVMLQASTRANSISSKDIMLQKQGGGRSPDCEKIKVAIIGGGIAGLSCASHLAKTENFEPTVFDTGRLRPGGRCSSRLPGDKPKNKKETRDRYLNKFVIDHAAQILALPPHHVITEKGWSAFAEQVKSWENRGVIRTFPPDSIYDILEGVKRNKPNDETYGVPIYMKSLNSVKGENQPILYYGVNGNGSIATDMMTLDEGRSAFVINQDVWISPSNGVKFVGTSDVPKWSVQTNGRKFGTFDRLVIAHNGKCADRLMSKTPSKELHSLLRTNFAPTVPASGGKKMTLNSIYSLTIALPKDESPLTEILGSKLICAYVKNQSNLRFITCQSRKDHGPRKGFDMNDNVEVWTILSSAKFAKKYKAPQENIPVETVKEVTSIMLSSLEKCLDLKPGKLHSELILDSQLQLWGAAVPINTWVNKYNEKSITQTNGFVYDSQYGVGACGDWLLDPSIGGAWESGMRLSEWLLKNEESKKYSSVGLPPNGFFNSCKTASVTALGNIR